MEQKFQEISEVVKEVRRIRHELSAEFGHDPHKFGEYCRELEKELRKSGKYKFAESPQQKPETSESSNNDGVD